MQKQEIGLRDGATFSAEKFLNDMMARGVTEIVQGQQAVARAAHTKPHSFDFYLRAFGRHPDTKQAQNSVLDEMVAAGQIELAHVICPDSGRRCKGFRLVA